MTWRHQTIQRPGGIRLAVWVREPADPDTPTVVLVHGYPDTHVVWDAVIDELPRSHRLVVYDVRGTWQSSAPGAHRGL